MGVCSWPVLGAVLNLRFIGALISFIIKVIPFGFHEKNAKNVARLFMRKMPSVVYPWVAAVPMS